MEFLQKLNIQPENAGTSTGNTWLPSTAPAFTSFSPVDGKSIAAVTATDKAAYTAVVNAATNAFAEWRGWPAPRRGEVVRQIGEALRRQKPTWAASSPTKWAKASRKAMARSRR